MTMVEVESRSVGCRKNGALTLLDAMPTICSILGEVRITKISVKGLKKFKNPWSKP